MRLLRRVENFLKQSGMTPTRFGREAARDPRLVHDMRRGREPRRNLARRLEAYIAAREQGAGQ